MYRQNIPTVDDLTPTWFTDLPRSSGDLDDATAVASVDLSPFGSDESMMSLLYRARLAFDGPTEALPSLVIKLASPSEEQRFAQR